MKLGGIGWPSPPAVDEINNDDKAAKCSEKRMFSSLVINIKNFNYIYSRRPWPSKLISHFFNPYPF